MKRLSILILTIFILFFSYLSSTKSLFADNLRNVTVNKKYLRLRKRPNINSEVKETLRRNDKVTILERSGKWFKIRTSSNQGWVKSKYISKDFYTTDSIAEPPDNILNSNEKITLASSTMGIKSTNSYSNVTSSFSNVKDTLGKNDKVLPKMNNTASKNKLQEVSNEKDNYNRDEDF